MLQWLTPERKGLFKDDLRLPRPPSQKYRRSKRTRTEGLSIALNRPDQSAQHMGGDLFNQVFLADRFKYSSLAKEGDSRHIAAYFVFVMDALNPRMLHDIRAVKANFKKLRHGYHFNQLQRGSWRQAWAKLVVERRYWRVHLRPATARAFSEPLGIPPHPTHHRTPPTPPTTPPHPDRVRVMDSMTGSGSPTRSQITDQVPYGPCGPHGGPGFGVSG